MTSFNNIFSLKNVLLYKTGAQIFMSRFYSVKALSVDTTDKSNAKSNSSMIRHWFRYNIITDGYDINTFHTMLFNIKGLTVSSTYILYVKIKLGDYYLTVGNQKKFTLNPSADDSLSKLHSFYSSKINQLLDQYNFIDSIDGVLFTFKLINDENVNILIQNLHY